MGSDLDKIQVDMAVSLEWAVSTIRDIQKAARSGKPIYKPRWPILILRSPKGWTGPKSVHGKQIEGTFHAHQVPLPKAKKDEEELQKLREWLEGYNPKSLFDECGKPIRELLDCFPEDESLRMGMRRETHEGSYRPLELPDWEEYAVQDQEASSSMHLAGQYLGEVCDRNPRSFRIFSPDELTSNKLTKVLDKTTRTMEVCFTQGRVKEPVQLITVRCNLVGSRSGWQRWTSD